MSYNLSGLMPGDSGITQTVNRMIGAVRWSVQNYNIRKTAERIIANCPERDQKAEVEAIYQWVLRHYKFVSDPRFLELFKSPEAALTEIATTGKLQGDCDDVSGLLAALLVSVGYPVKFVVISIPGKGDDFRHIYPMVYLSKSKRWLALEATARNFSFGFEAPQGSRRREFPV